MTTPTPAARSGAADAASQTAAWRPVLLWSVFLVLLVAGLVLAVMFGSSALSLADQVN